MIYLFTGTPGSGKSLHAARIVLDRLKLGKPVLANFEINADTKGLEHFHYVDNFELTPQLLMDFARSYFGARRVHEEELTLIVDEAQLVFNCRDWSQGDRMAWIKFLSQHRHFGYRIILVCQSDRMIDRQIRSLAEYDWQHRKLANYGAWGAVVNALMGGNWFVCVKVYYGLNDKLGSEFFRGGKKYYRLYDSYNLFQQPADGGTEAGHGDFRGPMSSSAVPSRGLLQKVMDFAKRLPFILGALNRAQDEGGSVSEEPSIPKADTGVDWDEAVNA